MQATPKVIWSLKINKPKRKVKTTLYDLVSAIADDSPIDDDHIIANIVTRLLHNGRAKFVHGYSSSSL